MVITAFLNTGRSSILLCTCMAAKIVRKVIS
jgi:hypothetical protein